MSILRRVNLRLGMVDRRQLFFIPYGIDPLLDGRLLAALHSVQLRNFDFHCSPSPLIRPRRRSLNHLRHFISVLSSPYVPRLGCHYFSRALDGFLGQMPKHRIATAALTIRLIRALSDLDDVPVRVPDVATNFAVLGDGLRDELSPSALP